MQVTETPQKFHFSQYVPDYDTLDQETIDFLEEQAKHKLARDLIDELLEADHPICFELKKSERPNSLYGKFIQYDGIVSYVRKQPAILFVPPKFSELPVEHTSLKDFMEVLGKNIKVYYGGIKRRFGNLQYKIKWQYLWVFKRRIIKRFNKLKKYVSSCIIYLKGLFQRKGKHD